MDFGITLILWAVVFAISLVLRPKPKVTNARPAGLGDFSIPTATEGRVVPLVWGTVRIDGPNVVWYGDFRSIPITKKVKTGLFSSKKQTIGFEYHLGLQFALCRGTIDALTKVWVGEKKIFDSFVSSGLVSINKPKLFGGEDQSGGLVGSFRVHDGDILNARDPYLQNKITTDIPAYRGTANIVWTGGNIGSSTQIQPWAFEVQRIPNQLGVPSGDAIIGTSDANPACVLYEILTDPDWGLGFVDADIDLDNLKDVAAILNDEGNGFSMLLDSPIQVGELINEIERQIDGVFFLDRTTGKFKVKLIRDDYTLLDVPLLDETNIIKVENFTRGSWQETTNNVRVQFVQRSKNYKTTYAMAQDAANIAMQGNTIVTSDERYPGVMEKSNAAKIAFRSLRLIAYPLAKAHFTVNRTLHALNPGDVVRWTDSTLGLTNLPMRITRVDLGQIDDGKIILDAIQDVFSFEDENIMDDPIDSEWDDPTVTVVPLDITTPNRLVFEAPHALCVRAEEFPGLLDRIWVGGRYPLDHSSNFQIWTNEDSAGYAKSGDVFGYLLLGKLLTSIGTGSTQGSFNVTIVPDPDTLDDLVDVLQSHTAGDIGKDLKNIIKIGDEFIGFRVVTTSGGNLVLQDCYRGLMDSIQEAHAMDTPVWFMSLAGNLTESSYKSGNEVKVKMLSDGPYGTLALADSTETSITMDDRAKRPYPPAMVSLNDVAGWADSGTFDYQTGLTLDTKGFKITLLRREFRTTDEVRSVLTEDALPPNFPDVNNTQYQIDVYNDPDGDNIFLFTTDWNDGSKNILLSRTKLIRRITETATGHLVDYVFDANDDSVLPFPWETWYDPTSGFVGDVLGNTRILQTTNGLAQRSADTDPYRTAYLDIGTPPVNRSITARVRLGLLGGAVQLWDRLDLVGHTQNAIMMTFNADDLDFEGNVDTVTVSLYTVTAGALTFWDAQQATVVGTATWEGEVTLEVQGDDYRVLVDGVEIIPTTTVTDHNTQLGVGFGFSGSTTPEVDGVLEFFVDDLDSGGGGFSFPTRIGTITRTRHLFQGDTFEAMKELPWNFDADTSELATLFNWSLLSKNEVSSPYATVSTGTFRLTIGTALTTGAVQVSINSGAFTTVIGPGATTGTFAITSGDTIQILHTQTGDDSHETFAELTDGSSVRKAFAILTY